MTSTIDLNHVDEVEFHLEAAAAELQSQWSTAIVHGEFSTIDRIVEASQAVHRALTALQADRLQHSA